LTFCAKCNILRHIEETEKMGGIILAIGDIIVGIDIGTSKVSAVVGEVNNFKQIEIICNTSAKCNGIAKGQIVDDDDVSIAISKAIKEAEEIANFKINSAYITIPGKYTTIIQNNIVKETKDRFEGVSKRDVTDALSLISNIEIPDDQTLIDIIPDKFILEDGKTVDNPIGNYCSYFTLMAQLILADRGYIKKITGICKKAGIEIDGIVPVTLAERNLVLDSNELNDNVMILDIGGGNTEIGVFKGNTFVYNNTIPLGGDNITSDIAYVLDISKEEADKLKRQYGLALKSFIDNDNNIVLNTYNGGDSRNKTIKSSELIEIIEARVEEIFSLINKEITMQGLKNNINNVILTGDGITNINKSDMAGKIILNIPVKISTARLIGTVKPTYRTSYALVRYVSSRPFTKKVSSTIDTKSEKSIIKIVLEKIRDFFYS